LFLYTFLRSHINECVLPIYCVEQDYIHFRGFPSSRRYFFRRYVFYCRKVIMIRSQQWFDTPVTLLIFASIVYIYSIRNLSEPAAAARQGCCELMRRMFRRISIIQNDIRLWGEFGYIYDTNCKEFRHYHFQFCTRSNHA
jgi:hypothetical protein